MPALSNVYWTWKNILWRREFIEKDTNIYTRREREREGQKSYQRLKLKSRSTVARPPVSIFSCAHVELASGVGTRRQFCPLNTFIKFAGISHFAETVMTESRGDAVISTPLNEQRHPPAPTNVTGLSVHQVHWTHNLSISLLLKKRMYNLQRV